MKEGRERRRKRERGREGGREGGRVSGREGERERGEVYKVEYKSPIEWNVIYTQVNQQTTHTQKIEERFQGFEGKGPSR